jgi:hypothetical protein
VVVLGGVFVGARRYQQARVGALVATYMRTIAEPHLPAVSTTGDDGITRVVVEGLGAVPGPTALTEDYVVLDIECIAPADAEVVAVYEQPTSPRERTTVPCSTGSRHWNVFWPIYQYPPSSVFERFELDAAAPLRITSIRRVDDLSRVPLLLKLSVPDDYRDRRWYQMLRANFFFDPLGARPSPKG